MKKISKLLSYIFVAVWLFPNLANALVISKNTDKVKATIITDKDYISSNSSLYLLIKLEMKDDWHTYWKNPGDAGLPTKVNWKLPNGYKSKIIAWTSPEKFTTSNLLQYGYSKTAYIKAQIYPVNFENKNLDKNFKFEIEWLACRDLCVPETLNFSLFIPFSEKDHASNGDWDKEIIEAVSSFPSELETVKAHYGYKGNKIILNVYSDEFNFRKNNKKIYFYPYDKDLIDYSAEQLVGCKNNNRISIETVADKKTDKDISGVLVIESNNATSSFEIKATKIKEISSYPIIHYENKDLLYILIAAFIGGLILNLMPCVFPILFIKALSIIKAENKSEAKKSAIFYFLGVVATFSIIASTLFALRLGGANIGWGFQLQSPIFIGIMIIIFTIIGLILLDLVKFGNFLQNKLGNLGSTNSFITGLLAVLVASPCTAPFMGIAIGYALTQEFYVFFPVFLSLAIGYALPFTLVGFYPNLMMKILPKPGKWMVTLKKIFAIPVFMTVIWLGWVLHSQTSPIEMASDKTAWKDYNKAEITQLIKNKEKVFINFTAKWCITCLINEQAVFEKPKFKELIKERNIHYYKADWTNKNSEITIELEKLGRNSVPLYVYYNQTKEAEILPQILNQSMIEEHLK